MAGMIFFFSAQNADLSGAASARVTRWLLGIWKQGFYGLKAREQRTLVRQYMPLVRKAAHFSEFLLLGLFLRLLLERLRIKWKTAAAWGTGALCAVMDELHQRAVSGRTAMAGDVLIDGAGALAGVLLALLLIFLSARRRRRRTRA